MKSGLTALLLVLAVVVASSFLSSSKPPVTNIQSETPKALQKQEDQQTTTAIEGAMTDNKIEVKDEELPAKQSADNILEALTKSLRDRQPPSEEKWVLGPAADDKEEDDLVRREDLDPEILRPAKHYIVTINRTRIAKMSLTKQTNIDGALDRWRDRMAGLIEPLEIETAQKALRDAEIKSYTNRNSIQSAECYGTRLLTRATVIASKNTRIRLELLWINPKDPQAREAWIDIQKRKPQTPAR